MEKPEWLKKFKKQIALIEAIDKAYEINCNCAVCQMLRKIGQEMEEIPQVTSAPKGGE